MSIRERCVGIFRSVQISEAHLSTADVSIQYVAVMVSSVICGVRMTSPLSPKVLNFFSKIRISLSLTHTHTRAHIHSQEEIESLCKDHDTPCTSTTFFWF